MKIGPLYGGGPLKAPYYRKTLCNTIIFHAAASNHASHRKHDNKIGLQTVSIVVL
jgi:hypothetical protein